MPKPLPYLTDEEILDLHSCDTLQELSQVIFACSESRIPTKSMTLMPLPHQFGHPFIISDNSDKELRAVSIDYIRSQGANDIWMERSPPNPKDTVIRHTDHTPVEVFLNSDHYQKLLYRIGVVYGLMANFWEGDTQLVWLGYWRTLEQGDYSDAEVEWLKSVYPHFHRALLNLARRGDETLRQQSLRQFIDRLPVATLLLNSDLEVDHLNPEALDTLRCWEQRASIPYLNDQPTLPKQIFRELEDATEDSTPEPFFQLTPFVDHTGQHWNILAQWLLTPGLATIRGTFLLQLERDERSDLTDQKARLAALAKLSTSERRIAHFIASGLSNREIAQQVGRSPATIKNQVSSILRKLGMDRRQHVIRLLSGSSSEDS